MFLAKMTAGSKTSRAAGAQDLARLLALLPSPMRPLTGRRAQQLSLPDNIVCFCRRSAADLNRPQRGRALHHRFVLILALQTGVTVRVDDKDVPLREGEGLLVFPFQFHDYADAQREKLLWLFITFDMVNDGTLETARHTPFAITAPMLQTAAELVAAFLKTGVAEDEMTTLLAATLLAHIKRALPAAASRRARNAVAAAAGTGLMTRVNELTEGRALPPSAKEISASLGISTSHLRAKFRASCGVSLGKHLRRLRLEKARGLLRLSTRRVTEIAEMCGFSSVYTFSRAFRAVYGVAPLAFRQGRGAGRV